MIVLVLSGMVSQIVRKLGPSIVLFAFIWAMHSKKIAGLGETLFGLPMQAVLAAAAIFLGILSMALRDSVHGLAKRAHGKARLVILGWVLRKVNNYDLSLNNLHRLDNEIANGLQCLAVISLLTSIAVFAFPVFALVLGIVCLVIVGLSVAAARHVPTQVPQGFLHRLMAHPDYYVEALVVAGLVIAFLAVADENSMVSGTVYIYLVSRFTNCFKVVAKAVLGLYRARKNAQRGWEAKAQKQAADAAKKLERARTLAEQKAKAKMEFSPEQPAA